MKLKKFDKFNALKGTYFAVLYCSARAVTFSFRTL